MISEPTTAELVEQVRMCVEAADSDIWGNPSILQEPARAALATLSESIEAAERERDDEIKFRWKLEGRVEELERERDEYKNAADGMARAPYGEFVRWAERAQTAEARVQELEQALREIKQEQGYGAVVAARMREIVRAALEPPEPFDGIPGTSTAAGGSWGNSTASEPPGSSTSGVEEPDWDEACEQYQRDQGTTEPTDA